jgi:hypothetical protein
MQIVMRSDRPFPTSRSSQDVFCRGVELDRRDALPYCKPQAGGKLELIYFDRYRTNEGTANRRGKELSLDGNVRGRT